MKKGLINFRKKYDGTVLSLVQGASGENYFNFRDRWYSTFIKTFTLDLMVYSWCGKKKANSAFRSYVYQ